MKKDKSQRIGNQPKYFSVLFLTFLSFFANRVNGFELELSGTWGCEQRETISDSMTGENKYTLVYSDDSSLVNQSGNIRIIDVTRSLESSIKYELQFEFSNDGNVFENTLMQLEHEVTSDQLNLLNNGVRGLFPVVGETISVELELVGNDEIRTLHDNGTVTRCLRQ